MNIVYVVSEVDGWTHPVSVYSTIPPAQADTSCTNTGAPMCRVYLVVKGTGKARTLVSIKPTVEQSVADLLAQQPSEDYFLTEYDFGEPNPHLPEHICQEVEEDSND